MLMTEENYFLTVDVKALTIKQPYASLMLPPVCKIETRTWSTPYRGWVLICAAKAIVMPWMQVVTSGEHQATRIMDYVPIDKDSLHRYAGHAIGIGQLVDCRLMTLEDEDACFVDYKPGRWCHVFRDVMPIKPFPHMGQLGYTDIQEPIKRKIFIDYNR